MQETVGKKLNKFILEGFVLMKEYTTENIRNVALVSHSGAGKTMLAEVLLHQTGATNRIGKIQDGTTTADFADEEIRRQISLSTSMIPVEFGKTKINFLDTPGFTDFVGEMISALAVSDGAVVVVDSVSGAEVGTEIAWGYCDDMNIPRILLVNKMDRENADFNKAINSVKNISDMNLVPVQLPWGEKADYKGIIDLLTMKAYPADGSTSEAIPADMKDFAEEAQMELIEAAAEGDDALMEKYFDAGTLSAEEIISGLKSGMQKCDFALVFCTSATNSIGLVPFMQGIVDFIPSPAESRTVIANGPTGDIELKATDNGPLSAYVWKTTADPFVGKFTYFRIFSGMIKSDSRIWNQTKDTEERLGTIYAMRGKEQIGLKTAHAGDIFAAPKLGDTSTGDSFCDKTTPIELNAPNYPNALYRVAISPATQADSAKMGPTLARLSEEDMTLSWFNDHTTKETIFQGMGDQHIDVAIRKARDKFQVNLELRQPRIPYRETITKKASAQYRHKKQSGGSGQFGEVHLRIEPSDSYEFVNEVFGGSVSSNYMPAIEKGIKGVMSKGVIAGYPVSDLRIGVYDGKEHPVDSKPMAFEVAGREAFKIAVKAAGPKLLEPIMIVKVTVPEDNMGDIMGDLNTRRGRVQGMDSQKGRSIVTAHVPMAELMNYTTELRSMTGGRGVFTMEEDHYEQVPTHLQAEIIAAEEARKEAEEAAK